MEILGLHAFADNYIWLLRQNGNAVAVDPGDARPVLHHLRDSEDRLSAILVTHHHPDHVGGVSALTEHFNVPVFGPENEDIPHLTCGVQGGETIEIPGIGVHFDVLDVGGHTRGHVAYYRPKVLFCGDALFVLGCGRLFEGTPVQMAQSLARIAALPRDTKVYCAHEYARNNLPFALAVEPGNALLQKRADRVPVLFVLILAVWVIFPVNHAECHLHSLVSRDFPSGVVPGAKLHTDPKTTDCFLFTFNNLD